jgi:putative peptidoglycan lipid II flippase
MAGIGLNAVFDWLLVGGPTPWGLQLPALNFGAPGLVLATVAVNLLTCLGLLLALQRRLGGLPLAAWARDSLMLLAAAVLAGGFSYGLSALIRWPGHLIGLLLQCGLCAAVGLLVYGVVASWAGVPEATQISRQLGGAITRRLPLKR